MQFSPRSSVVAAGGALLATRTDAAEDLVWTATDTGYVASRFSRTLARYTSFRAHEDAVLGLAPVDAGIVSLSARSLRLTHRRGLVQFTFLPEDKASSFTTMTVGSVGSDMIVADSAFGLTQINTARGQILRKQQSEHKYKHLVFGRYLACATQNGNIELRDPKTWRIEHKMIGHTGEITDMDKSGTLLATCGLSTRNGHFVMDYLVKIYDLRMMRSAAPIPVASGPSFVRFHPKSSSVVFAASQAGQVQVSDLYNQDSVDFFQLELAGYGSSFDISSTGQMFFYGETSGILQHWADGETALQNFTPRPIELPTIPTQHPHLSFDDDRPLSSIGMPYYREKLLSAWLPQMPYLWPQAPAQIPNDVLASMKTIDFVGYAPNTGKYRRNQRMLVTDGAGDEVEVPKFRSEQARERFFGSSKRPPQGAKKQQSEEQLSGSPGTLSSAVPKHYRLIEIKYSRFGVEDFDFGFYNKSPFSGLETHIVNSYCNSMLQALFFYLPLRELLKAHIKSPCPKDFCLSCELGFLFRMLEDGKGVNCQATNFLRAFSTVKQAGGLGLFEMDDLSKLKKQESLMQKIQTLNRFILEHLHQELSARVTDAVLAADAPPPADLSVIQQLYGIPTESRSSCLKCMNAVSRKINPFVVDLSYTKDPQAFTALLKESLNKTNRTKAWCDVCRKYQATQQEKRLHQLPKMLNVNINALTEDELKQWTASETSTSITLPTRISLALGDGGDLEITDLDREDREVTGEKSAVYQLVTSIVEVRHEADNPHLVAHIKNTKIPPMDEDWFLFNDFLVQKIPEVDAIDFRKWKAPAIVQFARFDIDSEINPDVLAQPMEQALVDESRLITPGEVCAIDAEFVAVTKEEFEIHADGSKTVLRPSRLTLARVSVLKSDESILLDDYVIPTEPIVDYLTEFSGIRAQDLDRSRSRHNLLPLKTVYKKMRVLIDMGCRFVGHGLYNDFRIINTLVPKAQIVDTLNIFHIENRQRRISLRFLSWYMLNTGIQLQEHDSIEDARMALRLFKVYEKLEERGMFEQVLLELYDEGSKCQWKAQPVPSVFFEKHRAIVAEALAT